MRGGHFRTGGARTIVSKSPEISGFSELEKQLLIETPLIYFPTSRCCRAVKRAETTSRCEICFGDNVQKKAGEGHSHLNYSIDLPFFWKRNSVAVSHLANDVGGNFLRSRFSPIFYANFQFWHHFSLRGVTFLTLIKVNSPK